MMLIGKSKKLALFLVDFENFSSFNSSIRQPLLVFLRLIRQKTLLLASEADCQIAQINLRVNRFLNFGNNFKLEMAEYN